MSLNMILEKVDFHFQRFSHCEETLHGRQKVLALCFFFFTVSQMVLLTTVVVLCVESVVTAVSTFHCQNIALTRTFTRTYNAVVN